jgi:O-antigen biosynthesis protein WbqP
MLRTFDLIFSALGLICAVPLLLILLIAGFFDTGSPLFLQTRVGRNRRPFTLVKFRTMRKGAPQVATHLTDASAVTALGKFLRRTKLDELPQLWNVLKGEMSIVGPRPCLPIQQDLIGARAARGVFRVRPGITGLAQVREIDMSKPALLAEIDARMISSLSLRTYCFYIMVTFAGRGFGDRTRKESNPDKN